MPTAARQNDAPINVNISRLDVTWYRIVQKSESVKLYVIFGPMDLKGVTFMYKNLIVIRKQFKRINTTMVL